MNSLSSTADGSWNDRSDVRRKRLLFRSWHRGTQETDLILGSFAESSLASFDTAQLDRFEALLDCADVELFDWMAGRSLPPTEYDHDVMRLLRSFRYVPGPQRSSRQTDTPGTESSDSLHERR
jgi:antitoxin CptB